MTFQAQRTRTLPPEQDSSWGRDAERLLALLEDNPDDTITIAAIRERGIDTPAQVIYALQLAGYDIDAPPRPEIPAARWAIACATASRAAADGRMHRTPEHPMSPDAGQDAREDVSSDPITVRVEHNALGWQVTLPHDACRVTCETFDDARRIAYLCAAHTRRCELIVHDSCYRHLHHEMIEGHIPHPTRRRSRGARPMADALFPSSTSSTFTVMPNALDPHHNSSGKT